MEKKLVPEIETEIVTFPSGEQVIKPVGAKLMTLDATEQNLEKIARAYIMSDEQIGKRKDIKQKLEDKVIGKIGRKGKYLTDKLFELIEGVYVIDSRGPAGKGVLKYYKRAPDLQAIIYALDRVIGKPVVRSKEEKEKEGITVMETMIKQLAGGEVMKVERSVTVNKQ